MKKLKLVFKRGRSSGWLLELRWNGGAGFSNGISFFLGWNTISGKGIWTFPPYIKKRRVCIGATRDWKSVPKLISSTRKS